MLGLAIAFGIGGKDLAQSFLERRFVRGRKIDKDDEPARSETHCFRTTKLTE